MLLMIEQLQKVMETVTATFSIPDWIDKGLKNQTYERVGGIIRDSQTKHIVAWLCEAAPTLTQTPTTVNQKVFQKRRSRRTPQVLATIDYKRESVSKYSVHKK